MASPSVAQTKAAFATRKTSIGPAATKLATTTSCGRMVPGSSRVSTFGIAMSSQKRQKLLAPQTARVALSPSVVQAKAALAIGRMSIGRVATRHAATVTCGRMVLGSTKVSTFGIATFSRQQQVSRYVCCDQRVRQEVRKGSLAGPGGEVAHAGASHKWRRGLVRA